MGLDFLEDVAPKLVRTTLYNDQEFSRWELEILHTPLLQRLYNLKQLGFADRVFPDAVHSRLNHILGVTEVAERLARRLVAWLKRNPAAKLAYADERLGGPRNTWPIRTVEAPALAEDAEKRIPIIRLIGFLHDLTHAAYGHTLEDEVRVFSEKHDNPTRQIRFFDALVGQLIYFWCVELGTVEPDPAIFDSLSNLDVNRTDIIRWAEDLAAKLPQEQRLLLAVKLRELEAAFWLLLRLEFLHMNGQDTVPVENVELVSAVILKIDSASAPLDLCLHKYAFLVDIVGNTICADLLDYARRDPHNSALKIQFDDRLLRYVCVVSAKDKHSPTGLPCIRSAMQFFTDKMRHDVLSEMSGILKARYLITERVLFHPTKCAAGAMLGTTVKLLGMNELPAWMQALGDQDFLRVLLEVGSRLEDELSNQGPLVKGTDRISKLVSVCLSSLLANADKAGSLTRAKGARVLLWRLISRRFHKPIFRIRSGVQHSGGVNDESLAAQYTDSNHRFALERKVEGICALKPGSLVIHCPVRKMSMKIAQALVVGDDPSKIAHLRDVNDVSPESLDPYRDEIQAVERMYKSIWQIHAFLDSSQIEKKAIVIQALEAELDFPNDKLLSRQLSAANPNPYDLLAGSLKNTYAPVLLPEIVRRLGTDGQTRMREGAPETAEERTIRIISEVSHTSSANNQAGRQLKMPGIDKGLI